MNTAIDSLMQTVSKPFMLSTGAPKILPVKLAQEKTKGRARMKRLYVIGNGFDLYHGIPSSYRHFGEFLRERDSSAYRSVEEYLHAEDDDFWFTFEQNLAT